MNRFALACALASVVSALVLAACSTQDLQNEDDPTCGATIPIADAAVLGDVDLSATFLPSATCHSYCDAAFNTCSYSTKGGGEVLCSRGCF